MKHLIMGLALVVACAGIGCQSASDKSEVHVSGGTLDRVDPPGLLPKPPVPPPCPADGFLPGADKIYFVGDRKIVRSETESKPVLVPEATRRLLVGNAGEADISYQPALLPRELAEELARSRQINEQNRMLMAQMVTTSRGLVETLEQLKRTNLELAERLERQVAYTQSLGTQKTPVKPDEMHGGGPQR